MRITRRTVLQAILAGIIGLGSAFALFFRRWLPSAEPDYDAIAIEYAHAYSDFCEGKTGGRSPARPVAFSQEQEMLVIQLVHAGMGIGATEIQLRYMKQETPNDEKLFQSMELFIDQTRDQAKEHFKEASRLHMAKCAEEIVEIGRQIRLRHWPEFVAHQEKEKQIRLQRGQN